jgi:hypothetical protein
MSPKGVKNHSKDEHTNKEIEGEEGNEDKESQFISKGYKAAAGKIRPGL